MSGTHIAILVGVLVGIIYLNVRKALPVLEYRGPTSFTGLSIQGLKDDEEVVITTRKKSNNMDGECLKPRDIGKYLEKEDRRL